MTLHTQFDRRSPERRSDGVTSKILHAVFAMRRGFGNAAAKNLLLRNGHDDAFIEQVLAIPEDRRDQRRRTEAAPAERAATPAEPAAVTLDAAGMAVLHRLRFEADSGMHRMTILDCPAELQRFGLMQQDRDGTPTITAKGRLALKHFACVRALDSLARGTDAIPMSEEISAWLEANAFLLRQGKAYGVTELGKSWLAFNATLAQRQP
ncbi:hypothetical protein [Massilia sp. S19_KUP03_FR1]|uniref:hypothetical protein n=1 Tax=Massilia sp. S19_KUP03_FR1 TaxID=3025503 RepID=UPI002FCDD18C